jgi:hypothetical protein
VRDGIITRCEIKGHPVPESFAGRLNGCRHMTNDIKAAISGEDFLFSGFDVYNFF